MTDLHSKIMRRARFINVDGNGPEFERGRETAHICLRPLIQALAKCVEQFEGCAALSSLAGIVGEE